MNRETQITIFRTGRRLPIRSTWRRVSTVASAQTILHRRDRIIEADGRRWRVENIRDGLAILRAESPAV
ncbi:MAG: hypothetical protein F4027_07455 [Rhodospirillaceae bacterium]|nr:hypothetical protein [Rhodospirillaceae bacterium]MYK58440.1 hypothetical protein [Rhodospirillaceae bacterium]